MRGGVAEVHSVAGGVEVLVHAAVGVVGDFFVVALHNIANTGDVRGGGAGAAEGVEAGVAGKAAFEVFFRFCFA